MDVLSTPLASPHLMTSVLWPPMCVLLDLDSEEVTPQGLVGVVDLPLVGHGLGELPPVKVIHVVVIM